MLLSSNQGYFRPRPKTMDGSDSESSYTTATGSTISSSLTTPGLYDIPVDFRVRVETMSIVPPKSAPDKPTTSYEYEVAWERGRSGTGKLLPIPYTGVCGISTPTTVRVSQVFGFSCTLHRKKTLDTIPKKLTLNVYRHTVKKGKRDKSKLIGSPSVDLWEAVSESSGVVRLTVVFAPHKITIVVEAFSPGTMKMKISESPACLIPQPCTGPLRASLATPTHAEHPGSSTLGTTTFTTNMVSSSTSLRDLEGDAYEGSEPRISTGTTTFETLKSDMISLDQRTPIPSVSPSMPRNTHDTVPEPPQHPTPPSQATQAQPPREQQQLHTPPTEDNSSVFPMSTPDVVTQTSNEIEIPAPPSSHPPPLPDVTPPQHYNPPIHVVPQLPVAVPSEDRKLPARRAAALVIPPITDVQKLNTTNPVVSTNDACHVPPLSLMASTSPIKSFHENVNDVPLIPTTNNIPIFPPSNNVVKSPTRMVPNASQSVPPIPAGHNKPLRDSFVRNVRASTGSRSSIATDGGVCREQDDIVDVSNHLKDVIAELIPQHAVSVRRDVALPIYAKSMWFPNNSFSDVFEKIVSPTSALLSSVRQTYGIQDVLSTQNTFRKKFTTYFLRHEKIKIQCVETCASHLSSSVGTIFMCFILQGIPSIIRIVIVLQNSRHGGTLAVFRGRYKDPIVSSMIRSLRSELRKLCPDMVDMWLRYRIKANRVIKDGSHKRNHVDHESDDGSKYRDSLPTQVASRENIWISLENLNTILEPHKLLQILSSLIRNPENTSEDHLSLLRRALIANAGNTEIFNAIITLVHAMCVHNSGNISVIANTPDFLETLQMLHPVVSNAHPGTEKLLELLDSVRIPKNAGSASMSPVVDNSVRLPCILHDQTKVKYSGYLTVSRAEGLTFVGENQKSIHIDCGAIASVGPIPVRWVWHGIVVMNTEGQQFKFNFRFRSGDRDAALSAIRHLK